MPDIPIIYEDNHLLIVCKPPNLPTQADSSGDPDLLSLMKADIKQRYDKPGAVYLGLVHRLDRPVGGLVALARTSKAAGRLSAQLREHSMRREYLAVVQGSPLDEATLTDYLIKDSATNTVRIATAHEPKAKQAILAYRCLERVDGLALLAITLETGRSHQIRVQMANAGHALWGDARYGHGRPGEQIALWGTALTLMHPTRGEHCHWQVKPPDTHPWSLFDTTST